MEQYKIIINRENKMRRVCSDEMEFIQLKFVNIECRRINDSRDYRNDEISSYCIICDERTGELIADLSEDDYLNYQDEFEWYCTSKYRRCA